MSGLDWLDQEDDDALRSVRRYPELSLLILRGLRRARDSWRKRALKREELNRSQASMIDTRDAMLDELEDKIDSARAHARAWKGLAKRERERRRLSAACAEMFARHSDQHEAQRDAALAVLRGIEWIGADDEDADDASCPWCARYQMQGHTPGCALNAALRGGKE